MFTRCACFNACMPDVHSVAFSTLKLKFGCTVMRFSCIRHIQIGVQQVWLHLIPCWLKSPTVVQGAHSIQSICMGHSIFAKCCAFVCPSSAAHPVLLSGGGDSTVRYANTTHICTAPASWLSWKRCKLRLCWLKGSSLSFMRGHACKDCLWHLTMKLS